FERRQSFFEGFAVGIVGPAVKIAAGQAAIVGFLKCGGLMDGGGDVARAALRAASGMDGDGLNFHDRLGYNEYRPVVAFRNYWISGRVQCCAGGEFRWLRLME